MSTDEELIQLARRARGKAHRAPLAKWSMDHKGHSSINNHTRAYVDRTNDLIEIMQELDKRGIPMPECDCEEGAHKTRKDRK